jgi:hypothetical protein
MVTDLYLHLRRESMHSIAPPVLVPQSEPEVDQSYRSRRTRVGQFTCPFSLRCKGIDGAESGHDNRCLVGRDQRWGMSLSCGRALEVPVAASLGRLHRRWQFGRCDTPSEKLLRN